MEIKEHPARLGFPFWVGRGRAVWRKAACAGFVSLASGVLCPFNYPSVFPWFSGAIPCFSMVG